MIADKEKKQIIADTESIRRRSDAIIVVGIMPDDRIFYSVDDRVTVPDLQGILQRNLNFVCSSIAKLRATKREMARH